MGENDQLYVGLFRAFADAYVDPHGPASGGRYTTTPYGEYTHVEIKDGFFGHNSSGDLLGPEHYPSVAQNFVYYLQNFNPMTLWVTFMSSDIEGQVSQATAASAATIHHHVDTTVLPEYLNRFRDINAVQSSSMQIGVAQIRQQEVRTVAEIQSKFRLAFVDVYSRMWMRHLDWNRDIVTTYHNIVTAYYTDKIEYDRTEIEYEVKDRLWSWNLYDDLRAAVGALNGAAASGGSNKANMPSQAAKTVSAGMSGAAMGASTAMALGAEAGSAGGIWGAAIGAAIGIGASFL